MTKENNDMMTVFQIVMLWAVIFGVFGAFVDKQPKRYLWLLGVSGILFLASVVVDKMI